MLDFLSPDGMVIVIAHDCSCPEKKIGLPVAFISLQKIRRPVFLEVTPTRSGVGVAVKLNKLCSCLERGL